MTQVISCERALPRKSTTVFDNNENDDKAQLSSKLGFLLDNCKGDNMQTVSNVTNESTTLVAGHLDSTSSLRR